MAIDMPLLLMMLCLFPMSILADVRLNPSELYLSTDFQISSIARTRSFSWTVTNETAAPDGFTRNVLAINSQFPGPLIEANEGDTLNIRVTNKLSSPLTIHWHGISQNGSPWMDGVTAVTQCPIPVGGSFTYSFNIMNQYGTFFYHAHTQNYMADGVAGPLIVHSVNDPLRRGVDFDQDVVIFVSDWYHTMSEPVVKEMLSERRYHGYAAAPSPDSALLNGVGYFDCSYAGPGANCQTPTTIPTFDLPVGTKTRFRIIEAGVHAMFRFSVDNHTLNVTEADSIVVAGPTGIHRVPFHNGQRYSVIIDMSADTVGSSFYIRAAIDLDCFAWVAPGMTGRAGTALGIIRVVDKRSDRSNSAFANPNTRDWSDPIAGPCVDLDQSTLIPLVAQNACKTVLGRVFFNTGFRMVSSTAESPGILSRRVGRFLVNNVPWLAHPNRPLLHEIIAGRTLNSSEVSAFSLENSGCYDIVINNRDTETSLSHPYHLHGGDSWLVATGLGALDSTNVDRLSYQTTNPIRRDTYLIAPGSYAVVRLMANNPGVWVLHCHVGWHLAAGFAGILVVRPSVLKQQSIPAANQALCKSIPQDEINKVEPAKRKRSMFHASSLPPLITVQEETQLFQESMLI